MRDVEDALGLVQAGEQRRSAPDLPAGAETLALREGAGAFGELVGAEQLAAYGTGEQLSAYIGRA